MSVKEQTTAVIARFADPRQAQRYVDELKQAGFQDDEIGVLSPHEGLTPVETGAAAGALTGGTLGAIAGAAVTGLIPGIGPVLAAGALTGVVGGAAAGGTAGGLVGALVGLGISEDDAQTYEDDLAAGRTLVVVEAVGRTADAWEILQHCKGEL